MFAAFCSLDDLKNILHKINEKYNGNIIFAPSSKLDMCIFKLVCKDSKGAGAWLDDTSSYALTKEPKSRVVSACYHVYKDFFDMLFELDSEIKIFDKGTRISKNQPLKEKDQWCYCQREKYEKELKEQAEEKTGP